MNERPPFLDTLGHELHTGRRRLLRRRRIVMAAAAVAVLVAGAGAVFAVTGDRSDPPTETIDAPDPAEPLDDSDGTALETIAANGIEIAVPNGWTALTGPGEGNALWDPPSTRVIFLGNGATEGLLSPPTRTLLPDEEFPYRADLGSTGVAVNVWERFRDDPDGQEQPFAIPDADGMDFGTNPATSYRLWGLRFVLADRNLSINIDAGPEASDADIQAAIDAARSLVVGAPHPIVLDDHALTITPPPGWLRVPDTEDPNISGLVAFSRGLGVGLTDGQDLNEQLEPGDIYLRLTETTSGNGSATPTLSRRPEPFTSEWGSILEGSGVVPPGAALWSGGFWENGRTFSVILVAGSRWDPRVEDAWASLDSLIIEPAEARPAPELRGEWREADTTFTISELVPHLIPFDDKVFVLFSRGAGGDVQLEIYDPLTSTATAAAPSEYVWRHEPAVAWTGRELILLGGGNGPGIETHAIAYNPATDSWRSLSPPPGAGPSEPSVGGPEAWTGAELILTEDDLAYEWARDRWSSISPSPLADRIRPVVVWTGTEVIVWGGCENSPAATSNCDDGGSGMQTDGAAYDPLTDSWRPLADSPLAGGIHPAGVWAGTELVIFAGDTPDSAAGARAASYDPVADTWRVLADPPIAPRHYGVAAWTGRHVIIWGGRNDSGELKDGAAYHPLTDTWTVLAEAPDGAERDRHAMAWIGNNTLYIVGGWDTNGPVTFHPVG